MMRSRPVLTLAFCCIAATAAAITLVSVQEEIQIGQQAQRQARAQVPELRDAVVTAYIRSVGRRIAAVAAGPRYPYSFSVANYREINAFALPGGPVWVHRGAIAAAQNESQIAGVLAHEIAHIAQRHAADQLTKAMLTEGILGVLGAVAGRSGSGRAAQTAARVFAGGLFLKFSRDDEREADRVGAGLMRRAGWNAQGMVGFMHVLRAQKGRDPGSVETFFSSHPSPEGRIQDLQQTVSRLHGGTTDSQRFQSVRSRLKRLPPAQSMPRR